MKFDIAADAGKILLDLGEHAAGRVLVVVERIVGERVADQRNDHRAVGKPMRIGSEVSPLGSSRQLSVWQSRPCRR